MQTDWGEANEYEAMLYKSVKKRVEMLVETLGGRFDIMKSVKIIAHDSGGMKERVAYTTQILRFHFDNRIMEVDYEYIVNVSI